MRTMPWLFLVPVLALAACATKPQIASDYDHSTRFSTYHSFMLIMRPHQTAENNPFVAQRACDAIKQALSSRGFVYVADPAQADFAVDFTIGARDRADVSTYPAIHGPWLGAGGWGNQIDVRQYHEGTLAIDVFDVRSRRVVWHGSGKKELSESEMEHSQGLIQEAVAGVLADFPPKMESAGIVTQR